MGAAAGQITVVSCWAQARRKFHDLHQASQSLMAEQAIKPIVHIDAVERQVKGLGRPVLFPCRGWPAGECSPAVMLV